MPLFRRFCRAFPLPRFPPLLDSTTVTAPNGYQLTYCRLSVTILEHTPTSAWILLEANSSIPTGQGEGEKSPLDRILFRYLLRGCGLELVVQASRPQESSVTGP